MDDTQRRRIGRLNEVEEASQINLLLTHLTVDRINGRAEGARAYVERLVREDFHYSGVKRDDEQVFDPFSDGAFEEFRNRRMKLLQWRIKLKDQGQWVDSAPIADVRLEDLESIVPLQATEYVLTAEQLKSDGAIVWMTRLTEKDWFTPAALWEFFLILKALGLAGHT